MLQSLRTSVTSSGNPLSEAEMDRHTLKGLRDGAPGTSLHIDVDVEAQMHSLHLTRDRGSLLSEACRPGCKPGPVMPAEGPSTQSTCFAYSQYPSCAQPCSVMA